MIYRRLLFGTYYRCCWFRCYKIPKVLLLVLLVLQILVLFGLNVVFFVPNNNNKLFVFCKCSTPVPTTITDPNNNNINNNNQYRRWNTPKKIRLPIGIMIRRSPLVHHEPLPVSSSVWISNNIRSFGTNQQLQRFRKQNQLEDLIQHQQQQQQSFNKVATTDRRSNLLKLFDSKFQSLLYCSISNSPLNNYDYYSSSLQPIRQRQIQQQQQQQHQSIPVSIITPLLLVTKQTKGPRYYSDQSTRSCFAVSLSSIRGRYRISKNHLSYQTPQPTTIRKCRDGTKESIPRRLFGSTPFSSSSSSSSFSSSSSQSPTSSNPTTTVRYFEDDIEDIDWTVGTILQRSIELFERMNNNNMSDPNNIDIEPIQSTIHLLSYALELPWDTGYRDLYTILQQQQHQEREQNQLQQKEQQQQQSMRSTTVSPSSTVLSATTVVSKEQLERYESYIHRRLTNNYEPIQYIVGQWDFLHYCLLIQKPLLCPRPETEELVVMAVTDIQRRERPKKQQPTESGSRLTILDIGCGTGCIGIAVADQLSNVKVDAIDIEPIAVTVSNQNAERILGTTYQQRYQATLCSIEELAARYSKTQLVLNNITDHGLVLYDYIISNPPYILRKDIPTLSPTVKCHESIPALSDNTSDDGMDTIRSILQILPTICKRNAICYFEVDPTQPVLIEKLLSLSSSSSSAAETSSLSIVQDATAPVLRTDDIIITATTTTGSTSSSSNQSDGIIITAPPTEQQREQQQRGSFVKYLSTEQDMFGKDRFVIVQVC